MVNVKVKLELSDIKARLKALTLPEVDAIVGIATGGSYPATLLAYETGLPLHMIRINYRAPDNRPQRPEPALLEGSMDDLPKRLLLVDDVSVSGQTLDLGKSLLKDHEIVTLVLKGKADIALFDIPSCVHWPWNAS